MRIVALLLAAGSGSRMGLDKLAVELDGVSLRDRALAPLLGSSWVAEVLLVVRPGAAPDVPASVRVVENPEHASGMASSIRAGVAASPNATAWLIAFADMPSVAGSTVDAVAAAVARGERGFVVPIHGGRRGHPVALAARYREELLGLTGDVGARAILRAHPDDVLRLAVDDPGIQEDVDTVEDLDALRGRPL